MLPKQQLPTAKVTGILWKTLVESAPENTIATQLTRLKINKTSKHLKRISCRLDLIGKILKHQHVSPRRFPAGLDDSSAPPFTFLEAFPCEVCVCVCVWGVLSCLLASLLKHRQLPDFDWDWVFCQQLRALNAFRYNNRVQPCQCEDVNDCLFG